MLLKIIKMIEDEMLSSVFSKNYNNEIIKYPHLFNYITLILSNHIISSKKIKKIVNYRLHTIKNNDNILNNNQSLINYIKSFYIKFNFYDIDYFKNNYNFTNNDIYYIYENTLIYSRIPIYNNINKFRNLKALIMYNDRDLCDNDIKNLIKLEQLVLPKNRLLTDKSIKNLDKLKVLELDANKNITNISLINKIDLRILKMVHNKKINDDGFINLKKLKYLNLGYNNNRKLNLKFLKHNDLQTLILYKKKNISEDIISLMSAIEIKYTNFLDLY